MSFKPGPVLTPGLLNNLVASQEFYLFQGTTTMACALKLHNGFVVVGLSASLPTTEFDPKLGMEYSLADAERKLGEYLALLVYDGLILPQRSCHSAIGAQLNVLKENYNA